MKHILQKLKEEYFSGLSRFQEYFLCPKVEHKAYRPHITLNGCALKNPMTLFLKKEGEGLAIGRYAHHKSKEPPIVIAVMPAFFDEKIIEMPNAWRHSALCLKPAYLEEIIPMINCLRLKNEEAILALFYISQIPCRAELVSTISAAKSANFNDALSQLLLEIKKLDLPRKIVVMIDSFDTLGKKNSAFLGRMFKAHPQ